MENKKQKQGKEGEDKCNHEGCWRKAKHLNGVKFGRKYFYFCDEHIEQAMEVASI